MDSHLGLLVWAAIVIFGVVSSIVQNIRKAKNPGTPGARVAPRPAPRTISALEPGSQTGAAPAARRVAATGAVAPAVTPQVLWAPPMPTPPMAPAAPAYTPAPAVQQPRRAAAPRVSPPNAAARISPPNAAAPRLDVLLPHERPRKARTSLARLFGDKRSLVRAVIASEVLGKPRALRDE